MWGRIKALIIKEILAVWRDKKSRAVLILPPILQLLIFSFAITLDVNNVSVGILNRDNGSLSFELIERFRGSPFFTRILTLNNISEIADVIDKEKAVIVFQFDEEFSRKLQAGETASVQAILDGRKSNTAQIVQGYASEIIQNYSQEFQRKNNLPILNTALFPYNWYNPNLIYQWFTVPSLIGILSMLIGLIITGLSVARERELGTFDQLLVSPLSPSEILFGKTLPAILIGMIEGSFVAFAAIFFFKIPFEGSFLLLYFSIFVFICSIVGVGLFISSLAKTQQQAILGVFVFMPPAVMLSGFATPVENMPVWLQNFTWINPLRHFLVIVKAIFLKGIPWEIAFSHLWPMALMAVITLTGAGWFFRRRLE